MKFCAERNEESEKPFSDKLNLTRDFELYLDDWDLSRALG